jgi:hypothetical protein
LWPSGEDAFDFGEGGLSSWAGYFASPKPGIDAVGSTLMEHSFSATFLSSICSFSTISMGDPEVKSGTTTALSEGVMALGVALSCLTMISVSSMLISSESVSRTPDVGLDLPTD